MRNKLVGGIGAGLLLLVVLTAVFAPVLAPFDPSAVSAAPLLPPGGGHLLGTNDIGQDIFSELLHGARSSLLVGGLSAAISLTLALAVGMLSGWFAGTWLDRLLMKLTAFFLTLPFIPAVIVLAAFSGAGTAGMAVILGVLSWPETARVLRAQTIQIRARDYLQSIRAMGAGDWYILTRHVLRELLPLVLYQAVLRVKSGILMESSMSFLGLGTPLVKSWGSMIFYAQSRNALITGAWVWWVIPPGLCICLVCLALMMISYSLEGGGEEGSA
ncbi:ABC transporter permease [Lawsonibacter faecis]|uniref:ABC transporter permease n=1 Tax=Lawsonibacter faecis TaxID=2763052 RepID=A0A8J6MGZ8_9FIRM|nr:ABC transporter permease [Lawsonibacter faecis]MBC5737793.1 ABC transporter permease [Lawsonibacter faecis]